MARRELTPHDAARQMVDRLSGDGSSHHKP
jgi:hypothetical protein